MNVLSLRTTKYIKLALLSPILEKTIHVVFLFLIPFLAFFNDLSQPTHNFTFFTYKKLTNISDFMKI